VTTLSQTLTNLIEAYGLLAIILLMAAESCGVPFPSEVIMPVGGVLAAAGHLNLAAVILGGGVGNLLGSLLAYGLAARLGTPALLGPGRWIGIRPHHLDMANGWFGRYGRAAVFLGRVLPVVRTYISFPAGLSRVPLGWFSALTFTGALPWCAALALAGYFLGMSYSRITGPIEKAAIVLAILVAAVVVGWLIRGRSQPLAAEETPLE
jgi:membrane protein DedA with SNARE-associated domain